MPVYIYKCGNCGASRDVFKRIAELDRREPCKNCLAQMERQLAAPAVLGDYAGYKCPITDKWIEGRRAHEENLKKHGCRILEPGETQRNLAAAKVEEETLLDSIAETAASVVANMPAAKQEALATELTHGADLAMSRSTPKL